MRRMGRGSNPLYEADLISTIVDKVVNYLPSDTGVSPYKISTIVDVVVFLLGFGHGVRPY